MGTGYKTVENRRKKQAELELTEKLLMSRDAVMGKKSFCMATIGETSGCVSSKEPSLAKA